MRNEAALCLYKGRHSRILPADGISFRTVAFTGVGVSQDVEQGSLGCPGHAGWGCSTGGVHLHGAGSNGDSEYNWRMKADGLLRCGLKRLKQIPRDQFYKQPATGALIAAVSADTTINIGIRTAILVAWECMLRCLEYTSIGIGTHNPLSTLLGRHVRYTAEVDSCTMATLHVPHSKGNVNKIAVDMVIPPHDDSHCAVKGDQGLLRGEARQAERTCIPQAGSFRSIGLRHPVRCFERAEEAPGGLRFGSGDTIKHPLSPHRGRLCNGCQCWHIVGNESNNPDQRPVDKHER